MRARPASPQRSRPFTGGTDEPGSIDQRRFANEHLPFQYVASVVLSSSQGTNVAATVEQFEATPAQFSDHFVSRYGSAMPRCVV
jgi:hypothetical protein